MSNLYLLKQINSAISFTKADKSITSKQRRNAIRMLRATKAYVIRRGLYAI